MYQMGVRILLSMLLLILRKRSDDYDVNDYETDW